LNWNCGSGKGLELEPIVGPSWGYPLFNIPLTIRQYKSSPKSVPYCLVKLQLIFIYFCLSLLNTQLQRRQHEPSTSITTAIHTNIPPDEANSLFNENGK